MQIRNFKLSILKLCILFPVILLVFTPNPLQAQISGYAGKHFALKTDLMPLFTSPKGWAVELEMVPTRRFSLSLGVQSFSRSININTLEKQGFYYISESGYDPRNWEIDGKMYSVALKLYNTRALTAPLGIYSTFRIGFGGLNGRGKYPYEKVEEYYSPNSNTRPLFVDKDYQIKNIGFYQFEWGGGYQWVLFKRFLIDTNLAFVLNCALTTQDKRDTGVTINDLAFNHIALQVADKAYPNLTSLTLSQFNIYQQSSYASLGLQFRLMVGLLLF